VDIPDEEDMLSYLPLGAVPSVTGMASIYTMQAASLIVPEFLILNPRLGFDDICELLEMLVP